MNTYQEIEDAALSLPPQARATLVDHLVESLDPEAQKRLEAYWIKIAEQRFQGNGRRNRDTHSGRRGDGKITLKI